MPEGNILSQLLFLVLVQRKKIFRLLCSPAYPESHVAQSPHPYWITIQLSLELAKPNTPNTLLLFCVLCVCSGVCVYVCMWVWNIAISFKCPSSVVAYFLRESLLLVLKLTDWVNLAGHQAPVTRLSPPLPPCWDDKCAPPSCFITSITIIIIDTGALGPERRSSRCLERTLWTEDLSDLESWSTVIVCTQ